MSRSTALKATHSNKIAPKKMTERAEVIKPKTKKEREKKIAEIIPSKSNTEAL